MSYNTIKTEYQDHVFHITINRPQVHNALNLEVVQEMIMAMRQVAADQAARAVVLRGEGRSFCAGADIHFVSQAHGTPSLPLFGEQLQELLFELVHCRVPVITLAKGSVYGGALGLLAASDIVVSADDTRFSFSETKIGMVPAAILPFVNKRIGTTNTRYLMLTAKRFDASEAMATGLVNRVSPPQQLEQALEEITGEMMQSSPQATMMTKQIINAIDNRTVLIDSASYSINFYEIINESAQVKEGLQAFREKRKPSWVPSHDKNDESR